jgi:hypothetical protein
MFGGANPTLKDLEQNPITHTAADLSPYRWSQEALYISEIKPYGTIYNTTSYVFSPSLSFSKFISKKDRWKIGDIKPPT